MKYDAVFFDFDGTVADTLQNITDAINHTMRHFGREELSSDAVKRHLGWGVDYLMRKLLPSVSDSELEEILSFYRAYYAQHATDNVRPFPGVLPMMEKLCHDGLKLAIVSNKPDAAMQPVAKKYFRSLVSLAIGERPGITRKPAPDMLIYTANELGVELSRCLYVGDTEIDIQTARNTAIDCICVTWGFRAREALLQSGALQIADNTEELIQRIETA